MFTLVRYTVEPVLGDLWFGRPLVLGNHNHWHGSFLTIKYLAWATTCQTRPATGSFGLTDDSFTCSEWPDHANFRQYCRIWSWKLNSKTGGNRKRRSPPKPIVADYPLGGASSLLFTKSLRGRILFIVLELFVWSLSHLTFSNICMYENAQFAIKYCFLILRNVYSSKKCVDSEINPISLKNHDGICSGNLRKVSEHLRDHFQLSCAPMPMYSTIRKHYKMFESCFIWML